MQSARKTAKLLTVKNGWISCPTCNRNHRMMQVLPDTEGHKIVVYCRVCKTEHVLNIVKGECFESYGQ